MKVKGWSTVGFVTWSKEKYCQNHERLTQEHLIGCRGVNLFLLKDITISTVTTATVTTVTITNVPVSVFRFSHSLFLSFFLLHILGF